MQTRNNGPQGPNETATPKTLTPELGRTPFQLGSVVAQLTNDQFNDLECAADSARAVVDPADAAWGRGWNTAVRRVLAAIRAGRSFSTDTYSTTAGDEISIGFARGYNAGLRHAVGLVAVERGLRELAHAPVIRTMDLGLKNALVGGAL